MTANHQNGGRAVGACASDLRNPPAYKKPQFHELIAFMRSYGLAPAETIEFVEDGVRRFYRIEGDPPGVMRGFYIAHPRKDWGRKIVAFGLVGSEVSAVAPSAPHTPQLRAARSLSALQTSLARGNELERRCADDG